ncbi:MAG: ferredoxin--NADP reductase [Gammaproteobacteria bacterium]
MSNLRTERVLSVHHWNETLFSFRTTRDPGLRFENGHFVMIGLMVEGRPLLRAYSIASANHEEDMEFFSIKVQDGPLTKHLQKLQPGDELLVGRKPTGTLTLDNIRPGRRLWLLGTGTGLAPFLSIVKDPETYARYEQVIVVHGVRWCSELAYADFFEKQLPDNEYFGDEVRAKLKYYPTVTREPFRHQGRITDLIESGRMVADLGLPPLDVECDRFLLCGSPSMLKDTQAMLDALGFAETRHGDLAEYAIERAFVEK